MDYHNNNKQTGKARLELTATITMPDGTVVERKVSVDDLPGDIDTCSIEGFRRDFDKYERPVVEARNKVCDDITTRYLEELKKRKDRKD